MERISTGFGFVYGLVILFVCAILMVIFTFVLDTHYLPVISSQINASEISGLINSSVATEMTTYNNKMMDFWNAIPYVIVIGVIILWVVLGIRKGQNV